MRFRLMLLGLVLLTMFSASGVFAHEEDGESKFADDVTFLIDGEAYQLEGTTNEQQALPGHEWLQVSETEYFALHHNIGPDASESWWATEAVNDELLYVVNVVIDTWTPEKAEDYADRGYVYYHPLVSLEDGTRHPEQVAWMQHIALTIFNLDGGPRPLLGHEVVPGIDRLFMPNWSTTYEG